MAGILTLVDKWMWYRNFSLFSDVRSQKGRRHFCRRGRDSILVGRTHRIPNVEVTHLSVGRRLSWLSHAEFYDKTYFRRWLSGTWLFSIEVQSASIIQPFLLFRRARSLPYRRPLSRLRYFPGFWRPPSRLSSTRMTTTGRETCPNVPKWCVTGSTHTFTRR